MFDLSKFENLNKSQLKAWHAVNDAAETLGWRVALLAMGGEFPWKVSVLLVADVNGARRFYNVNAALAWGLWNRPNLLAQRLEEHTFEEFPAEIDPEAALRSRNSIVRELSRLGYPNGKLTWVSEGLLVEAWFEKDLAKSVYFTIGCRDWLSWMEAGLRGEGILQLVRGAKLLDERAA